MRRAFTFIELLIYLSSMAFLATIVFSFFLSTQNRISILSKQSENEIRAFIATDLMRRDLMSASSNPVDWNLQDKVFKKNVLDKNSYEKILCVGFKADKDGLKRLEGDYDFSAQKWRKKITSRVNYNVKNLKFKLKKSACGRFVEMVQIKVGDLPVQCVCLRSRCV
jgi:type II secretory pathway component PulJ